MAMEAPSGASDEAIRDEQAKVLRTVRPMSVERMMRGQYVGFREEPGVAPDSYMATYAALCLLIDSWRWEGVPFYVRAGKRLAKTVTEVTVTFKRPPPVVFDEPPPAGNYVRFRLSPEVVIAVGARAKRPGEGMRGRPVELLVAEQPAQGEEGRMDAYERLLGDAMAGDSTLFARQDVVEAAWAIVDPVIHGRTWAAGTRRREDPQGASTATLRRFATAAAAHGDDCSRCAERLGNDPLIMVQRRAC
jgi:glucose-6-phosphate 1-dehydrogenase